MQKDKVSYVNGGQLLTSAVAYEDGYLKLERQPNSYHADKEDGHRTSAANPGTSAFAEETPYSNIF